MTALFATPTRRMLCWSLVAWFVTRELQVLVTLLTLPGTLGQRFSHWYFWDAKYYRFIAQYGYHASDQRLAGGFFPLYPMLAHVLITLSIPWQAALLIVSNLATLGALVLVGFFVYHETGREGASVWAVVLLAVSPLGIFLSAMYSDSLFLALVAACWLAARTGHWRLTGILLALAIITRPFGALLALALFVEFIRQRTRWRELPWLVVPPALTLSGYLLALARAYGNPFAITSFETMRFGHGFLWPWQTLWLAGQQLMLTHFWQYPFTHEVLDLLPVLGCVACVVLLARRWPLSWSVYVGSIVLLCLILPVLATLASGQYAVVSDGRYVYAAAPVLLIPIACWLTRWPKVSGVLLLAASLGLQLVLVYVELHHGWLV